ncbi:MAG: hypothetical protein ABEJ30_02145 [Halorientalis sp.]
MDARAALDTDSLLKIVLVLVVLWLALSVLEEFVDVVATLLGPLQPILGLLVLVIIVLYLLDRI